MASWHDRARAGPAKELRVEGHSDTRARQVARLALASAVLLAVGCFEDPVEETLTVAFDAEGGVTVSLETRFFETGRARTNAAFAARLEDEQTSRTEGYNRWNLWFDQIRWPNENGEVFEREDERLVRHSLWARDDDAPSALRAFFVESPVEAGLVVVEGGAAGGAADLYELSIQAFGTDATRSERLQVERALDGWASALADYYRETIELWRYIEANPARAEACLWRLFDELIDVEEDAPELTEREEQLLDRIEERSHVVLELFELPGDRAFTLQELSRKVYDPFPARFVISLPTVPSVVEGFAATAPTSREPGGARFTVPRRSLWAAFEALEGRWLSPDPLVLKVRLLSQDPAQSGGEDPEIEPRVDFALADLMSSPFTYEKPPLASAIEQQLREGLEGEGRDFYRLSWAVPRSR